MSNLSNTHPVRSVYPGRLLLIDHNLSQKAIQGVVHGLDQLFSIVNTYTGLQRVPLFSLIVNGQNQSEVFIPLSSTRNSHMQLQMTLYKLQLLAQKWSLRPNRNNLSSSLASSLQLVLTEINNSSSSSNNNENRITSNTRDFQIAVLTSRLTDSILSELCEFLRIGTSNIKKIDLIHINDDDDDGNNNNKQPYKQQQASSFDSIDIQNVPENKYSISLYFKSWLLNDDNESEHLHLHIPTNINDQTDNNTTTIYRNQPSWKLIRCDLHEILLDPHHHINQDRLLLYTEPPTNQPTLARTRSSLTLPIYQLKALNLIKQTAYCISMIFGMPLLVTSTACSQKFDVQTIEENDIAFDTLIQFLRHNELMLICRLDDSSSNVDLFSGHFVLSAASEQSLILRSIASSEFLLPLPLPLPRMIKHEEGPHIDDQLLHILSNMSVDDEEYNPLYYEARKSKITIDSNLI